MSNIFTSNVDYATTTDIGDSNNGYTLEHTDPMETLMVDGVSPVVGDYILVKDQMDSADNGVYKVVRLNNGMDEGYQLNRVFMTVERIYNVFVKAGSTLASTLWCVDLGVEPYTPGVTPQMFSQVIMGSTSSGYNKFLLTADGTFPTMLEQGVSTLGELNAKQMWITLWGGGGGGANASGGGFTGASGGGSGSAVVRLPIDPNSSNLSMETLGITIGLGGAGGDPAGANGGNTSIISSDTGVTINVTAYGGGGARFDGDPGGGAGGTGGAANQTTGGIANTSPSGGGSGASGTTNNTTLNNQNIVGYWWTGVVGATGRGTGTKGSDFYAHGRGGAGYDNPNNIGDINDEGYGGGAGGFYGNGGDAGPPQGSSDDSVKDADPNSGAGGGGASGFGNGVGGTGGDGGVIIEWIV
jgi:hypothetical protein